MSELLAISIGPVQDFISAARKTRDLWFGSHLLSEISKAAATAVGPELLIFPAPDALRSGHVANVILAEVPRDPIAYRNLAFNAAQETWKEFVKEIWKTVEPYVDADRWKRQTAGPLEFFAAWTPLRPDYKAARREVMRLLAGSKACRNFDTWQGEAGVPKSSLDGARESVWKKDFLTRDETGTEKLNRSLDRKLRLAPREQLDLIGVVKRLGGGSKPYPSVSRLAADPWLRGLAPDDLEELREFCEPLAQARILGRIDSYPEFGDFPYEGTAIFSNRHKELAKESGLKADRSEDTDKLKALGDLTAAVKTLERRIPDPYLAILAADGDFMGRIISHIEDPGEHRDFSKRLSEFATEAGEIVQAHRGALVYSGGDDVLAFLPVDRCIECARALHASFAAHLKRWVDWKPSLSVGIAIGHFMEPLEDLREYARSAERAAKGVENKNALAVRLHPRGGAPVQWAASWDQDPAVDVAAVVRMYVDGRLPDKLAYEMNALGKFYEKWPEAQNAAITADIARWLKRKRLVLPDPEWTGIVDRLRTGEAIQQAAGMLLVGRKLARNEKQAHRVARAATKSGGSR
jgi:CRISPR-associated protein Cmr2